MSLVSLSDEDLSNEGLCFYCHFLFSTGGFISRVSRYLGKMGAASGEKSPGHDSFLR